MFYLMPLVFTSFVVFIVPSSCPGYRITFSGRVSLGSSWLWQFQTFFVFDDLDRVEGNWPGILQNIPLS